MSILAKNLKVIRRELGCTQSAMADILKVGFRTYVRYEAGERDAPVSVLVKISRLGNITLEQLLTAGLKKNEIAPVQDITKNSPLPEVKTVNFDTGQVAFKKPARQELMTISPAEKKLLTMFRKMQADQKENCLATAGKIKKGKPAAKGAAKAKSRAKKAASATAKKQAGAKAKSKAKANRKKPGKKK